MYMDEHSKAIYKYLDSFGIKHACKGYQYLFMAIKLSMEKHGKSYQLGKIYNIIAEETCETSNGVERAIRYVLLQTGINAKEFITRAVDSITINEISGAHEKLPDVSRIDEKMFKIGIV